MLGVFAAQQRDVEQLARDEVRQRAFERSQETGVPFPIARNEVLLESFRAELEAEIDRRTFQRLRTLTVLGLLLLVVLSLAIGYLVSGLMLRPVSQITARARELYARAPDLSGRIALGGPDDELRELSDTLDSFLARTEEAVDAHRRFLADASHELRTPISAAQTTLDVTLADPDADRAELREAGTRALEQLRRMGRLVSDLLFVERSAAAATEPVVVRDLIADVVDDLSPRAADRDIRLLVEQRQGVAEARPDDLRRALANLVENGIVHNRPGGEVRIAAHVARDWIELSVSDDGPGVDPRLGDTIFERHNRAGTGAGTGLGLAIVRELVERMGGRVRHENPPTGGARFVLAVPAAAAARSPEP